MRGRIARAVVAMLIVGVAAEAAAHGGHHRGHHHGHHYSQYGYYLGAPLWWGPTYDPYPYYYGPGYGYGQRSVIIEREPTVYVQREPVAQVPQSAPAPLWFYCTDPAGYFPYVKNCSHPWISVDPSTLSPPPGQ